MSKYGLSALATFVMVAIAVSAEWPLDGRDGIDNAIIKTLTLRHGEDIVPCLSAIKKDSDISDDAFSLRIVQLATVMTNGEAASFRGVAVSVLRYFGTTNALYFLENEILRGDVGAFSGYGAITGYDDRFFALAERLTADLGQSNYRSRFTVYCAMRPILKYELYCDRPVGLEAKEKAKAFLVASARRDKTWTDFIDQILCSSSPEYSSSPTRKDIAYTMLTDSNAPSEASNYYRIEIAKLEGSTNAQKIGGNEQAKATSDPECGLFFPALIVVLLVCLLVIGIYLWRLERHRRKTI